MPRRRHLYEPLRKRRSPARNHSPEIDVHLDWFSPRIGPIQQSRSGFNPVMALIGLGWVLGLFLLPWRAFSALRRWAR